MSDIGDSFLTDPEFRLSDDGALVITSEGVVGFRDYVMRFGNLGIPGGRYGSKTGDIVLHVAALERIMKEETGEPTTYEGLEHIIGLVVNSHDDVAYLIRDYGPEYGFNPDNFEGV